MLHDSFRQIQPGDTISYSVSISIFDLKEGFWKCFLYDSNEWEKTDLTLFTSLNGSEGYLNIHCRMLFFFHFIFYFFTSSLHVCKWSCTVIQSLVLPRSLAWELTVCLQVIWSSPICFTNREKSTQSHNIFVRVSAPFLNAHCQNT